MLLSDSQVSGSVVNINTTHARHINPVKPKVEESNPEQSFGDVFIKAFNQVNDLQNKSTDLAQQMITAPDSVDVHDVTIAMAEANMALSMTKSIVDGAIRAYKEIISTR